MQQESPIREVTVHAMRGERVCEENGRCQGTWGERAVRAVSRCAVPSCAVVVHQTQRLLMRTRRYNACPTNRAEGCKTANPPDMHHMHGMRAVKTAAVAKTGEPATVSTHIQTPRHTAHQRLSSTHNRLHAQWIRLTKCECECETLRPFSVPRRMSYEHQKNLSTHYKPP